MGDPLSMMDTATTSFTAFAQEAEPGLRRALVAALGEDAAGEALAEAFAYGWQHWERLSRMDNPSGYLYRVAKTRATRIRARGPVRLPTVPDDETPWIEPGLPAALARLPERQRVAVVLVHCFQYTHVEAAETLGISRSSVQNHVERGMSKLRRAMGVRR